MKIKLALLSLSFYMLSQTSYALTKTPDGFPKGCKTVGYEFIDNTLVLKPTNPEYEHQSIYLLQNKSGKLVTVLAKDELSNFVGTNWKMDLEPLRWSSFAVSKEQLVLQCQQTTASDEDEPLALNCSSELSVCEYTNALFGDGQMGTYWLITNKSMESVVYDTIKKGILLRW